MNLCPECNKNISYPNRLCRICEWKEWALYGMENEPQEIKDKFLEEMKKSISYQGAVLGQEILEFWMGTVEGFNKKYTKIIGWFFGDN